MKKTLLATAILLFSFAAAKAQLNQGDLLFGAGVRLGLPTGNFHIGHSFGIGAEIQAEYAFTDQLSGIATTGYTDFIGKTATYPDGFGGTYTAKSPSVGQIPVLIGARFYPSEQLFVGAQVGFGFYTGGGSSTSGFEYRPQVGYNADQFQVILSYDGTSVTGGTLGYVGLTAVFKFGGGR